MEALNLPSILTPDFGLLFWMLFAFLTLLFILVKFAFPVILRSLEERKQFIEESLSNARAANEKLAHIEAESERILKAAREQQAEILKSASDTRSNLINEARNEAVQTGQKIIEEARIQIELEKNKMMREVRQELVELSLGVAEKLVKRELQSDALQAQFVTQALDELE